MSKLFDHVNLTNNEIEKEISITTAELLKVLLEKNRMYNSASFKSGLVANWARLKDKVDRIESILRMMEEGKTDIKFESLQDTLLDVAGYGIIGSIIVKELLGDKKYGN